MLKLVSWSLSVDRLAGFNMDYRVYRKHGLTRTLDWNLVNVVLHYNVASWYFRWNMTNHMLSEEKKKRKLINTIVITRHKAIVVPCGEQLWRSSFSLFNHFPIKVNYITIKIPLKSNNWAPQELQLPIFFYDHLTTLFNIP